MIVTVPGKVSFVTLEEPPHHCGQLSCVNDISERSSSTVKDALLLFNAVTSDCIGLNDVSFAPTTLTTYGVALAVNDAARAAQLETVSPSLYVNVYVFVSLPPAAVTVTEHVAPAVALSV